MRDYGTFQFCAGIAFRLVGPFDIQLRIENSEYVPVGS